MLHCSELIKGKAQPSATHPSSFHYDLFDGGSSEDEDKQTYHGTWN